MALACAKASPSSRSITSWNGGGKSNVRRRDGRPGLGISTVTGHGARAARAELANFLRPDYNLPPPRLIAGWPSRFGAANDEPEALPVRREHSPVLVRGQHAARPGSRRAGLSRC